MSAIKPKLIWPVYEFRPLGVWSELFRYADGQWAEDDGQHDLAFYGRQNCGPPFALYIQLPYQRNINWSWYDKHWSSHEPRHPNGNAWHYSLKDGEKKWGGDWDSRRHPNSRAGDEAMNRCSGKYGCANGRGPELTRFSEYIAKGLIRERETKAIYAPPKQPSCMYCGDTDTRLASICCEDPRPASSTSNLTEK